MILLGVRFDHDVAVDEDGADDSEGKERVRENVDGDPPDGMEGREHEERLVSGEAEDGAALRDDDEGALVQEVGVDIADGSAGKLQREFAISTGDVVA